MTYEHLSPTSEEYGGHVCMVSEVQGSSFMEEKNLETCICDPLSAASQTEHVFI